MISDRIRELRKKLDLSMPEFGRRLGCSRDVIANLEYGRVDPKEVFLDHICEIYHVRRDWLLFGRGEVFADKGEIGNDDPQAREAAELFHALSPDLREWALKQLREMKQLMELRESAEVSRQKETGVETIELMGALLRADSFGDVPKGKAQGEYSLSGYIEQILNEKGLYAAQAEKRAHLKAGAIEGVVAGEVRPHRDTLLSFAVALELGLEQTQRLLAIAGMGTLYAQSRRDAAVIFVLMRGLSLKELQELLRELEEMPLIGTVLP